MEALDVASPAGLTAEEAVARRRAGEANTPVDSTSRSYATILRTNVFSFYNSILFVIGAALLAMDRWSDAFVSVGLGLVNAMISARRRRSARSGSSTGCSCSTRPRWSWYATVSRSRSRQLRWCAAP
jgi:cation-transporting P-type ATPase E